MEAQVSRKKKFIRDIGIYAVGNLGSKLITFLLVPLYTYYIKNPADFGYYDLCLSAVFMMTTLFMLQLNDGGFRYLIGAGDNRHERTAIITFVYKTLARNTVITALLGAIALVAFPLPYMGYMITYLAVVSYYDVTVQLVRGLGDTKLYVTASIISVFLVAVLSVVFLGLLGMQIGGIFLANILARALTICFLEIKGGMFRKYIRPAINTRRIGAEMLRYSVPLMPGTICWWIISNGNKFFLESYCGLTETGLYAVALKFSTILTTIGMIFYQAWQENAIRQYHTPDRDLFFSRVFNNYFYLLCGLVMFSPFILRWNYFWLTGPEYQSSSQYLYLLSICTMLFSLASFFDLGYQCSKQTRRAVPPFIIAAVVSVVGNFALTPLYGAYGIIAANLLSYGALLIYRAIDTRKYFKISMDTASGKALAMVCCGCVLYQLMPPQLDWMCLLLLCGLFIIFAPQSFRQAVTAPLHRRTESSDTSR